MLLAALDAEIVHDRGYNAIRVDRNVDGLMHLQVVIGTGPDNPEVVHEGKFGRPVYDW